MAVVQHSSITSIKTLDYNLISKNRKFNFLNRGIYMKNEAINGAMGIFEKMVGRHRTKTL